MNINDAKEWIIIADDDFEWCPCLIDMIHKWVKISTIAYFWAKNLIYSLVLIFGVRELAALGYT